MNSAKESIYLWAKSVVPVLLPFFIISKGLYYNGGGKLFVKLLNPIMNFIGFNKAMAFPLSMSIMCGYQTGARTVAQLEKDGLEQSLTEDFAQCCFSASPLFVIGTVGTSILGNKSEGYVLYLLHLCSLFITIAIISKTKQCNKTDITYTSGNLYDAISESIDAILNVCGYMIFFNLISSLLFSFGIIPQKITALLKSTLEITGGIKDIASPFSSPLPYISFFLSFGGICITTQCISYYKQIRFSKFIFTRIINGLISFILCFIYEKTALYVPIALTVSVVMLSCGIRRKNSYLLKSARS